MKRYYFVALWCFFALALPLFVTYWSYIHLVGSSHQQTKHGGWYIEPAINVGHWEILHTLPSREQATLDRYWTLVFYSPEPLAESTKEQLERIYRRWLMLGSKRYRTQLIWLLDLDKQDTIKPDWFEKQTAYDLVYAPVQETGKKTSVFIVSPGAEMGLRHDFDTDVSGVFADLMYLLKVG